MTKILRLNFYQVLKNEKKLIKSAFVKKAVVFLILSVVLNLVYLNYQFTPKNILACWQPKSEVIVCHATGSESNPYNEVLVDKDAWNEHASAHSDHPDDFLKVGETCVLPELKIYYKDEDSDQFGDPANSKQAESQPAGYVTDNTDCDDTKAGVNPAATEVCDGVDNNCNGQIDENNICSTPVLNTYYRDADDDQYGDPANSKQAESQPEGYVTDNTDCDDTKVSINSAAAEICDGVDNNCNRQIDENNICPIPVLNTYYRDADSDQFGDPADSKQAESQPEGYVTDNTDCDDTNVNANPNATEICDGIDNNCNRQADEDLTAPLNSKQEGVCQNSKQTCMGASGWLDDYTNVEIYEVEESKCDTKDNDCDGQIDESLTKLYYQDSDNDTYGAGQAKNYCSAPAGYVSDNSDCNDANNNIHPVAMEICDGVDNNCNGQIDENNICPIPVLNTYYRDADGDKFGNSADSKQAESQPEGYVVDNKDCDDTKASINPGSAEICDGIDNNCNGQIDENLNCGGTSNISQVTGGAVILITSTPSPAISTAEVPAGKPNLTISQNADKRLINSHDQVHFTIYVANNGNGVAKDVKITNYLIAGFKYNDLDAKNREWIIGDLKSGEIKSVSYTLTANNAKAMVYENEIFAIASNSKTVDATLPIEVKDGVVKGIKIENKDNFMLPDTSLNLTGLSSLLGLVLLLITIRFIIKKYVYVIE